jgi:hypothetical protein
MRESRWFHKKKYLYAYETNDGTPYCHPQPDLNETGKDLHFPFDVHTALLKYGAKYCLATR